MPKNSARHIWRKLENSSEDKKKIWTNVKFLHGLQKQFHKVDRSPKVKLYISHDLNKNANIFLPGNGKVYSKLHMTNETNKII